jgi:streptogramin lyase
MSEVGVSPNSGPEGITAGPQNALWFTEYHGNRIGRITTAGKVTEFPVLPNANSEPENIVVGPDHDLWFTEYGGDRIGRLDPTTSPPTVREYTVPTSAASPDGLTVGPDHALWFTEYSGDKIGRITTAGAFSEFLVPTAASEPETIVTGPDGALWFTESAGDRIGRITTSGQVVEFPALSAAAIPDGIALGPDNNLWLTEFHANALARLTPGAANALVLPSTPAPAARSVALGTTLVWTFLGPGTHTVSDTSGMGLFASGPQSFVSYYALRFAAAGTYAYTDTATAARARVTVPLQVAPASGSTTTTFTLTWAAAAPPAGFVLDVQLARPGANYLTWQNGATSRTATFVPDAGAGTYRFRARLRNPANGAASGYSPVKSISVS